MQQRHSEEIKPLKEAMTNIENWLLAKMNQDGCENYKTAYGTAYQSRLKSVKMEDPIQFKNYILRPAARTLLAMTGPDTVVAKSIDPEGEVLSWINQYALWDLADFRPGKKGIINHQNETGEIVPGVSFSEIINVNVRSS
jgi:hypothetical protein